MSAWTAPEDVRAAVQREWDSGRLLRSVISPPTGTEGAAGTPPTPPGRPPDSCGETGAARADSDAPLRAVLAAQRTTPVPFRVKLRRPNARSLTEDFDGVRRWVERIATVPNGVVEKSDMASRLLGSQSLPAAVRFDSLQALVASIGKARAAAAFKALVAATPGRFLPIVAAQPLQVLEAADDWSRIVAAAEWIDAHPEPGIYLRQADIPGVHTKVLEQHRRLIAALVDGVRPPGGGATAAAAGGRGWFERRYGFRTRPALVRFRQLDPHCGPVPGLTDITLTVAELAELRPAVDHVFVTENEVNFLSFPAARNSLVIFGSGNEAPETLARLPWLRDTGVHYWGDIDTHGFAILDRVRGRLPHTTSLLMDLDTLLAHRESWGREPAPTRRDLPQLTDAEAQTYSALLAGTYGENIRLEQEFVRFTLVQEAVAARLAGRHGRDSSQPDGQAPRSS